MTHATPVDPREHQMSNDVLSERARIEAAVAGRTLVDALAQTASTHADKPAYSDKHEVPEGQAWRTITWAQTRELALDVAAGLMAAGVQPGDTVAIMSTNRIEHFLADMGAVHAAATPMSIYNTLSQEQVAYVAAHAQPTAVILENEDHRARWAKALEDTTSIRKVVMLGQEWDELVAAGRAYREEHGDEVAARGQDLEADAPATILYTSGTTGNPKGVVLTHANVMYEALSTLEAAGLHEAQTAISYLPLAHIAERVLGLYGPQIQGSHMHAIGDPSGLLAALGEVHPTSFFGVPRVWEKIKTGLSAKLAADPDPANVKMVQDAMAAAQAWVAAQEVGGTMTPEIEEAYRSAEEQILGFLKLLLGLDQVTWAGSAAAPMPIDVARFMAGLGLKVFDVYGMTETCGAITANGPGGFKLGTVGRATPGMEVKLGEDNEVLVRGPVVTPGYHLQEDATRALIDEDGWVHTGDIGTMDEDGNFRITGRLKDMIIRGGENIYPREIEEFLYTHPAIRDVQVVGVPDEKYGEEVLACVILRDGMEATENEIIQFVKNGMSRFKSPRYVIFMNSFPMTASGKIQKYKLRETGVQTLNLQNADAIETA